MLGAGPKLFDRDGQRPAVIIVSVAPLTIKAPERMKSHGQAVRLSWKASTKLISRT